MRKRSIVAAGAALALATALGVTQASAGVTDGAGLDRFYRQSIAWHGCQTGPDDDLGAALEAASAQCGEVTVPLDYSRPRGQTITVAMSRLKAADPARRRGSLLINPGGPGGPGMQMVLIAPYAPAVAASYDLIGMDPRFIGRSTPLRCDWPTDTFTRSAGPNRRTFDASVALMRDLADGCVGPNRAVLPYASTRNTARDMDVIRAALHERKLNYLGYSYGTYLGAVYLQMFGATADRFVLDSAVDPNVFGPALLSRNGPATDAALDHWAGWAAARNGEYGLGTTRAAVRATVERLNQAANRRPFPFGEFRIDSQLVPYLLFVQLYEETDDAYGLLATHIRALSDAAAGKPVTPPDSLMEFLSGFYAGAGPATDRAGTVVVCADRAAPRDPEVYYRDIQAHRADEPLFGPMTRNITPCAFWPTAPAEPPTRIATGAPALIVGSDGDVATPYPGQLVMHRALAGSRMVTVRGLHTHGLYAVAGEPCVNSTVDSYLVDGVLPAADVSCARAGDQPATRKAAGGRTALP